MKCCTYKIYIDNEHCDDGKLCGKIPKYVTSPGPNNINQDLVTRLFLDMHFLVCYTYPGGLSMDYKVTQCRSSSMNEFGTQLF